MPSRPLRLYRAASTVCRVVPLTPASWLAQRAGRIFGPRLMPAKASQLARHLRRVTPEAKQDVIDEQVRAGFGHYGRFWVELFTLPRIGAKTVGDRFTVTGFEHIANSVDAGIGPILALPHLGGWEWAAAWLGRVQDLKVTAVVERLEPDDVFGWFRQVRSDNGINVVPLGSDALGQLVEAVNDQHVVCLLSDRDIAGNGITVKFFGEETTLPPGPALLARRTGAPILPTAVYFDGRSHHAWVMPPIWADPEVRLRRDVQRVTQEMATAMEELITQNAEQWHLLVPNWPSDHHES